MCKKYQEVNRLLTSEAISTLESNLENMKNQFVFVNCSAILRKNILNSTNF